MLFKKYCVLLSKKSKKSKKKLVEFFFFFLLRSCTKHSITIFVMQKSCTMPSKCQPNQERLSEPDNRQENKVRSLQKCHPAVSPNNTEFHNPERENVRDINDSDSSQEAISSGFFAQKRSPAVTAVHVERTNQEESEGADDAEGDVEFGGFAAEEGGLGRDEETPVEPGEEDGDEVEVEEKEREGNTADFKRHFTPFVIPHPYWVTFHYFK